MDLKKNCSCPTVTLQIVYDHGTKHLTLSSLNSGELNISQAYIIQNFPASTSYVILPSMEHDTLKLLNLLHSSNNLLFNSTEKTACIFNVDCLNDSLLKVLLVVSNHI